MGQVTRCEPMDVLLDRSAETLGYPHAVESTEGRVFDVVIFGVTPAAAAAARPLHLARLPIRVGRIPVAGEAQPMKGNGIQHQTGTGH